LRTGRWGIWQRYRGQTERGSWAARVIAQLGESVVLALLVFCATGVAGASASTPAPQKAPSAGTSGRPSPDPAPQADVKPRVSTSTAPAVRRPVVVSSAPAETTPRIVHVQTSPATTPAAPSSSARATTASPPVTPHLAPHRPTAARRPPVIERPRSQVTSLAFPLTLPRDLLLLPRTGTDSRSNGVLLLLSAMAMGLLTLASLSLLRRLRRLELQ
jgi:hypothetical protein